MLFGDLLNVIKVELQHFLFAAYASRKSIGISGGGGMFPGKCGEEHGRFDSKLVDKQIQYFLLIADFA